MTTPPEGIGAVPGFTYRVNVTRRLKDQSYQSRFENAMRLRARRSALKSEADPNAATYEELREARAQSGASWADIRLVQILRAQLISDYHANVPLGDRGFQLRALVDAMGLPKRMGDYHVLEGIYV